MSVFSIVSIKKVLLTLERLCLLELADFQGLLTFLSGWEGWWTSPCFREVTFSLQSHGVLPDPVHAMQIQEMGTYYTLWHMGFDLCFRQAGIWWGAHHISLTRWECSANAGLGQATHWGSDSSPTHLFYLFVLFLWPLRKMGRVKKTDKVPL